MIQIKGALRSTQYKSLTIKTQTQECKIVQLTRYMNGIAKKNWAAKETQKI